MVAALIIVVLVVSGYSFYSFNGEEPADNSEDGACLDSGGTWREFSNGCVDSCDLARNVETIFCAQVFTFGCDCGSDECWNGESCEDVESDTGDVVVGRETCNVDSDCGAYNECGVDCVSNVWAAANPNLRGGICSGDIVSYSCGCVNGRCEGI